MTKAFEKILGSLTHTRTGELSSIQSFPPLDIAGIAAALKLAERARGAGEDDRPPEGATEPDATELDVLDEIETRARKANEDYRSQISLYESRIRRALITHDQRIPIEAAAQNVLANFEVQTVDDLNHLAALQSEVRGQEDEFARFRKVHGLWRLPIIVPSHEVRVRWLVIAVIFLLESLVNGMFFATGSEAGLIGGVMEAMVLSALNIGAAVVCALFAMPYLRRKDFLGRLWGVLGVTAWIVLLLGLNLAIAHFRDLFLLHDGQVAWGLWLSRLLDSPIGLEDGDSVILGLLGVALGLFALIEASRTDDQFPGYGALARRRKAAIEDYAETQSQCLAGLQALRDNAVADMTGVIETVRASEYELRVALEGRERLHQNYVNYLGSLETAFRRLIKEYREANEAARSTPTPRYFSIPVIFPVSLKPDQLGPLRELEEDTRSSVVELMEKYIREINQGFRDAFPKYQSVGQLTAERIENAAT